MESFEFRMGKSDGIGRHRTVKVGIGRLKNFAVSVGIVKTLSLDGWICRLYR